MYLIIIYLRLFIRIITSLIDIEDFDIFKFGTPWMCAHACVHTHTHNKFIFYFY